MKKQNTNTARMPRPTRRRPHQPGSDHTTMMVPAPLPTTTTGTLAPNDFLTTCLFPDMVRQNHAA